MSHQDIFPGPSAGFKEWQQIFTAYAIANAAELGIPSEAEPPGVGELRANTELAAEAANRAGKTKSVILATIGDGSNLKVDPPFMLEDLIAMQAHFLQAYEAGTNPSTRTTLTIALKGNAVKQYKKLLRGFINQHIRFNPKMNEAHWLGFGLRMHDMINTPVGVPTDFVGFDLETGEGIGLILIKFHSMATGLKAIPKGYIGAFVAHYIGTNPPSDISLFPGEVATRSPYYLQFKQADRGQTVHIALCWINRKGQKGPWSTIISITIP